MGDTVKTVSLVQGRGVKGDGPERVVVNAGSDLEADFRSRGYVGEGEVAEADQAAPEPQSTERPARRKRAR